MKITVEKAVKAPITRVWDAWNTPELQRQGWQAILDSFQRHVERGVTRA